MAVEIKGKHDCVRLEGTADAVRGYAEKMLDPIGALRVDASEARANGADVTEVALIVDGVREELTFGQFVGRYGFAKPSGSV